MTDTERNIRANTETYLNLMRRNIPHYSSADLARLLKVIQTALTKGEVVHG